MSYSRPLSRPSLLELARAGNFRAIAYWINSLLAPHGINIQTAATRSGCLKILVEFHWSCSRKRCIALQRHLVRFICYRLWTLNSEAIQDVQIKARIAGEPGFVWAQSVRIVTPANRAKLRTPVQIQALQRGASWLKFYLLRSVIVGRIAAAGFFLCYWLVYWEAGVQTGEQQTGVAAAIVRTNALTHEMSQTTIQAGVVQEAQLPTSAAPEEFQGKIVRQVNAPVTEKVVALTFDDGPWDGTTEQVLDILKQHNVKATFFWVGLHIQRHPELARQVVEAGHAVGNHTWRHPLQNLDEATAAEEIGNTERLIYETTGVRASLFRPPGGNLNGNLVPYAQGQKYTVTLWSVESDDYYVSAPLIVDNVLRGIQPGGIVLLHDGGGDRSATVQALPQIITTLQQQGYRFVTVPELLEMQRQQTVSRQ